MSMKILTGATGAGDLVFATAANESDAKPNAPLSAGYKLSPEQAIFFKAETGIDNDDDLKTHILEVQDKAWKIFPYLTIAEFTFLRLGITSQLGYERIVKLGQERPDGIFLEIGSCFGVDARKIVADGFPLKNVVTSDLFKVFNDLGHDLFKTTPATYPINFVPGDVFDRNILQIAPPLDFPPSSVGRSNLSTLTSLNPLAGRCAVIYASNFFHLFSEEKQLQLAKALAGLLSPLPGSTICGAHAGNAEKGLYYIEARGAETYMFEHSPESWRALWEEEVFPKGTVKVDAKLESVETSVISYVQIKWSVVRL